MSENGRLLFGVCHDKKIRVYDLDDRKILYSLQESESITSLTISSDCKYLLVNLSSQVKFNFEYEIILTMAKEIHLWDINEKAMITKYASHKQGKYVIRSCFGGVLQNFVISGSEGELKIKF